MCSGRACAVQWNCVLECASRACTRVCSRARVCMCRAGAAERAYPCRERPARCRAAGPPDVRLAREGTRHGGLFTEVFFDCALQYTQIKHCFKHANIPWYGTDTPYMIAHMTVRVAFLAARRTCRCRPRLQSRLGMLRHQKADTCAVHDPCH